MSLESHFTIPKRVRFYSSGPLDQSYKQVLFALHGYGQLPKFFIRHFEEIAAKQNILVIAPEGMHRFYLKDSSGRVGASWMTKEDRLTDIDDYVNYLDLLEEHIQSFQKNPLPISLLAFSQGVATAFRWIALGKSKFEFLISWAGSFPPDLDFSKAMDRMENLPIHLVIGDQDEYINEEQFSIQCAELKERGCSFETHKFSGKHQMNQQLLEELFVLLM